MFAELLRGLLKATLIPYLTKRLNELSTWISEKLNDADKKLKELTKDAKP
jgi:hypothetical protein